MKLRSVIVAMMMLIVVHSTAITLVIMLSEQVTILVALEVVVRQIWPLWAISIAVLLTVFSLLRLVVRRNHKPRR